MCSSRIRYSVDFKIIIGKSVAAYPAEKHGGFLTVETRAGIFVCCKSGKSVYERVKKGLVR